MHLGAQELIVILLIVLILFGGWARHWVRACVNLKKKSIKQMIQ